MRITKLSVSSCWHLCAEHVVPRGCWCTLHDQGELCINTCVTNMYTAHLLYCGDVGAACMTRDFTKQPQTCTSCTENVSAVTKEQICSYLPHGFDLVCPQQWLRRAGSPSWCPQIENYNKNTHTNNTEHVIHHIHHSYGKTNRLTCDWLTDWLTDTVFEVKFQETMCLHQNG